MKYSIPEDNMDKLVKKLTKIEKFCKAHGLHFTFKIEGDHYEDRTIGKDKMTIKFIDIEVEGKAGLAGWTFLASLEHHENGNIVRSSGKGEIPTQYYNTASYCDHCKVNRPRIKTYVLVNDETGEYKQVGNSCLAHFIGGPDAEWYARYMEYVEELDEAEKITCSLHVTSYAYRDEALAVAYEMIRIFGYAKRDPESSNIPTSRLVTDYMTGNLYEDTMKELEEKGFDSEKQLNNEFITNAIAWVKSLDRLSSAYINNLQVLLTSEVLEWKNIGMLISLLPCYYNELNKREAKARAAAEAQANPSEWIGTVGDRIEVKEVTIKQVASYQTDFGVTYVYHIKQGNNVLIWKTGNMITDPEDSIFSIKGTIKDHDEFRGIKQTVLTRCKITERKTA